MSYDPAKHHRRSIRLRACDYSYAGQYFVTICAAGRRCLFGSIDAGKVILGALGSIVEQEWLRTPSLRPYVGLDKYVVMPNHLHGILIIEESSRGTARRAPTEAFGKPVSGSLPTIVRAFKSAVTHAANDLGMSVPRGVWQRGYFEHIIRDDESMERIREYIVNNPARWESDNENPNRICEDESDRWLSGFKKRLASREVDTD